MVEKSTGEIIEEVGYNTARFSTREMAEFLGVEPGVIGGMVKERVINPHKSKKGNANIYTPAMLERAYRAWVIKEENGFGYWRDVGKVLNTQGNSVLAKPEWKLVLARLKAAGFSCQTLLDQ